MHQAAATTNPPPAQPPAKLDAALAVACGANAATVKALIASAR